ncbi:MAG: glutamate--tRNA ligase [Spirochaetaceae bacterium]|nr:MAG: glutamate--tRNA ligase [Spirochaetaceae bacterium]
MNNNARVRYAPSPTGMQHIGGVRTALFNYFFARSRGGAFVLRVEDTDQSRSHPEALQDIYDTFEWLGIAADESPRTGGPYGPYVQSERIDLYRRYAEELIAAGRAYYDYTSVPRDEAPRGANSRDDVAEEPSESNEKGTAGAYNFEGRHLSPEEIEKRKAAGVVPVVRLLIPQDGKTEFNDLVLGTIKRKNKDLPPDPILLKSDGFPTYHLANVVDDHLMEITHVLRAQEWVPSTPLHLLIYEAFGWDPPEFAHLPMVMGKDGSKLSKRHGSTSVVEFRRQGYLPEAIMNYITLLGWSYDDSREFFTREELEELFSLEKINKAPAVFDYRKLDWFNGQYLRELPEDRLVGELMPYMEAEGWTSVPAERADRERLRALLPLIRERLKVLGDVVPLVRFLFEDVTEWSAEELIPKKATARDAGRWLELAWAVVEKIGLEDQDAVDQALRAAAEEIDTKVGNLLMPLRVAITGSSVSPPLVGSIRELGLERARKRVAGAQAVLERAATSD